MRSLALLLVVPVTFVYAQSTQQPPAQNPAPPPAVSQEKPSEPTTVEQTASPEIVGALTKDLAITPWQAQGAAGTLFGLAKTKLSPADFAKVAGAVPGMEGLLKAAPAADAKSSAIDLVTGAGGANLGSVATVAGPLMKLGLKPDTIAKLAPSLIKAVQSKGGAEVASLLTSAFKLARAARPTRPDSGPVGLPAGPGSPTAPSSKVRSADSSTAFAGHTTPICEFWKRNPSPSRAATKYVAASAVA